MNYLAPTDVNLRTARLSQGPTRAQLAEVVSVGRSSVARWESGANSPNDVNRSALAQALHMDVGELFHEAESETEVRYSMDTPTVDAEYPESLDQELGSAAESLAVEFVIGILIGVVIIAIVGLRLRKRRRQEPDDVVIG
jgi:transcriptional regulator with XRE-family HTH domain